MSQTSNVFGIFINKKLPYNLYLFPKLNKIDVLYNISNAIPRLNKAVSMIGAFRLRLRQQYWDYDANLLH
jgi:hypothetical protein